MVYPDLRDDIMYGRPFERDTALRVYDLWGVYEPQAKCALINVALFHGVIISAS